MFITYGGPTKVSQLSNSYSTSITKIFNLKKKKRKATTFCKVKFYKMMVK